MKMAVGVPWRLLLHLSMQDRVANAQVGLAAVQAALSHSVLCELHSGGIPAAHQLP
jgi:hypothetical protein